MNKDEIYKQPIDNIEDFSFDESVSRAFSDMVDRSVPGYRTLIANIGPIAAHFIQPQSHCYDLGCSHGAASLSVFKSLSDKTVKIIAVDNSPAMIKHCDELIKKENASSTIHTQLADIQDVKFENASVVILNLTLQFLPISQRKQLLENIYQGMRSGGACILTEKIILKNSSNEILFQQLHEKFKAANNYSQLEISQKRKALENVLVRESLEEHQDRLNDIGFSSIETWFQCINFVSLLAIK